MFDRYEVRYKIALTWILAFVVMWMVFQRILPLNSMKNQLNTIEESIEMNNWTQASEYTAKLKDNFMKNRMFIQMNNATEALTVFEHTIGQLEITVKYKQDSALEYIGALRETINLVIKPFSGP
ncbi:hypothetical protein JMF89_02950 [Clostridiaceae bacterium UIB06]|uniref:DUF4363 family protein n=1 Tax=Clostridium thailandense TaxID=2794346 RepID=A0A949TK18_9CLOT|nr:hypothetical protein [Clostridium thailandense]MBV7274269.1 hypothetical protein [Clostridium thailandense]MCH5136169.1 hypothetical protein [Clostridiaceae bacterium UIB06]